LFIGVLLLGMMRVCYGQEAEKGEPTVDFEVTADLFSKYILRGQNLDDDPVFQPGVSARLRPRKSAFQALSASSEYPQNTAISSSAVGLARADELSDLKERIRMLVEENRMLREKLAAMESTAATVKLPKELKTTKIEKKNRNGWMTAEYQFDTRGFNTINFTGGAKLPQGWSIWGFTDVETADSSDGSRADTQEYFMEIDLKKELYKGFGVVLEYNDGQARHNSIGRFGVNYIARWDWLKKMDLFLAFKAFPIETDGHGWQSSFCWEKKFPKIFDGRFSMGGFFDSNFDSGPKDNETNVVTETQFRYKLTENLEALVEFRFNEYLVASQEHGLGIGMKYKF